MYVPPHAHLGSWPCRWVFNIPGKRACGVPRSSCLGSGFSLRSEIPSAMGVGVRSCFSRRVAGGIRFHPSSVSHSLPLSRSHPQSIPFRIRLVSGTTSTSREQRAMTGLHCGSPFAQAQAPLPTPEKRARIIYPPESRVPRLRPCRWVGDTVTHARQIYRWVSPSDFRTGVTYRCSLGFCASTA